MSDKVFTLQEVSKHNKDGDTWIVIDGVVYDVSKFAALHPGGKQVLLKEAGKDATSLFHLYHADSVMKKYGPRFRIGVIDGFTPGGMPLPEGAFGDFVPYGDPIWYQRFKSPYYTHSHVKWRAKVRDFTEREIIPTLPDWMSLAEPPKELLLKMGRAGFFAAMMGPPWPAQYLPAEVNAQKPDNFDYFHELILYDEIARCGYAAVVAALTNGPAIALGVILRFGTEEMKKRVVPDVLLGKKIIALAISEPHAGSDVAGMVTTAIKQSGHYLVNGNKKWITNGTYADYFSTAVVTGKPGHNGISFLLIEREMEGFSTRKLAVRDSDVSGTAYLDFNNVKVPFNNLIGQENKGFLLTMYNFNHERFYIATVTTRMARVCLEESIKYSLKRQTFGKKLSDHQAIRMKIAAMIRQVEQLQTWLEFVTFQLCQMGHEEANQKVGDVISLLKAQASKVYEYCARETTMIFGGNALCMSGVGKKVEVAVAQVKGYQIPAGAEDIMDDFGARTAFKWAQHLTPAKL